MYYDLEGAKEQVRLHKYNGASESAEYREDVARLEQGEPLAYVLGVVDFLGAKVDLSYRPMIPREETAFWVERAISELREVEKKEGRPLRLADTFSGSGCIGLALLVNLSTAQVDISELQENLKAQIEKSVTLNNIEKERVRVFTADGFEGLKAPYDAIIANPPYIPPEALKDLDPEQRDFEPHLAFFAEDGGAYFHNYIITKGWDLLTPTGTLYMEADFYQHDRILSMVKESGYPWKVEFWKDPYGQEPFVVLRKKSTL